MGLGSWLLGVAAVGCWYYQVLSYDDGWAGYYYYYYLYNYMMMGMGYILVVLIG
jgi:hypothetical protein